MTASCTIRTMQPTDMEFAIGLAANEGWNPGLYDGQCFYNADPGGFFVAEFEDTPVGCISAVRYPEDFGFVGLYIVVPEHRGRGVGMQLWSHAMQNLAGMNVGLDGVVAQQENYRSSGFRLAHRNVRYEGRGPEAPADLPAGVLPLSEIPFGVVADYDRRCFPSERDGFLRCWLGQPEAYGYAATAGGDLRGWGLIRRCGRGWKIGPLFADEEGAAESLYDALAAHAAGDMLYLDTPEANPAAVALATSHSMTPVFETARMYTCAVPDIDLDRVFGVTTFELG